MTYEEATKFLKDVIAHPLKPNGDDKYPYHWRAKFNEILNLLDEQSKILRILKKHTELHLEEDGRTQEPKLFSGIDFEDIQNDSEKDWDAILAWLEGKGK